MFLFVLAYLGGVLTIVSPCILPAPTGLFEIEFLDPGAQAFTFTFG